MCSGGKTKELFGWKPEQQSWNGKGKKIPLLIVSSFLSKESNSIELIFLLSELKNIKLVLDSPSLQILKNSARLEEMILK